MPVGARNPKVTQTGVRLAASVDERLEALADRAGMNKGTMASMCIAAGLNMLERVFLIGVDQIVQQATDDATQQLASDVQEASTL